MRRNEGTLLSPCFDVMVLGGGSQYIHELWRWCFGIYINPLKRNRKSKEESRGEIESLLGGGDVGRCHGMFACVYTHIYTRVACFMIMAALQHLLSEAWKKRDSMAMNTNVKRDLARALWFKLPSLQLLRITF